MNETVVIIARWGLGAYLIWNAVNHFRNTPALAAYVAYKGMNYGRELVLVSGVLLGIVGFGVVDVLVPGWLGALAAVLFFVPVSVKIHDFWNVNFAVGATAAQQAEVMQSRQMEQIQFTKNLAILAGLLIALLA